MRAITAGHCYADGSKRTALLTIYSYVDANGLELVATNDEAVDFMKDCASDRAGIQEIAQWIRDHSLPRQD